jgi:hypothetical protein
MLYRVDRFGNSVLPYFWYLLVGGGDRRAGPLRKAATPHPVRREPQG